MWFPRVLFEQSSGQHLTLTAGDELVSIRDESAFPQLDLLNPFEDRFKTLGESTLVMPAGIALKKP